MMCKGFVIEGNVFDEDKDDYFSQQFKVLDGVPEFDEETEVLEGAVAEIYSEKYKLYFQFNFNETKALIEALQDLVSRYE